MWFAVLLFSLRAFVPAGFMPSVDALRDGRIEMVICSGSGGMRTIVLDAQGELVAASQTPHDGDAHDEASLHLDMCPFGVATSMVALTSMAPAMQVLAIASLSAVRPVRRTALPPLPPQGPPLGARAPPPFLG